MAFEYEALSDDELVWRIRKRGALDERPFTILFQRHNAMVWNVCRRFMVNDADAEDVLQDVFLRAYQGLPSFKGQSKFSTWLYRIAVNTCLNELRRQKRRAEGHTVPIDQQSGRLDLLQGQDEHHRREINEQLLAAMSSLTDDARQAIQMRELEGRSYAEIAASLGITSSAAKMRVQRARLAILAQLSEEQES
jgi:RNA polymerase sigma-70 factor (ECF subfamily)